MNFYGTERFGFSSSGSIMDPPDLGIVNGKITLNGWYTDIAAVKGLYAPPFFSDNFSLDIRFNGRRIYSENYFWMPMEILRKGSLDSWEFTSRLTLAAAGRAAMMVITVKNTASVSRQLPVQYEVDGGIDALDHWPFNRPSGAQQTLPEMTTAGNIMFANGGMRIAVASMLPLQTTVPGGGTFEYTPPEIAPQESFTFHTLIAIGDEAEVNDVIEMWKDRPELFRQEALAEWQKRVENLDRKLPGFTCSDPVLQRLYDRSLLHLLINEWNVDGYPLRPYYSTGGINGGCFCCYLWNYGEPYKLWSLLDPEAAKAHLRAYLKLDLTSCYAFYPSDLAAYGPYYPVNQEKILLLAHALVFQTGDREFLHEDIDGRSVIARLVEEALMHDDLSCDAVLTDYGKANNHLELRKEFHYNGIMPDMNLRRCVNFHLAAELCRAADFDPGIDLEKRAENLKKLIHEKLFVPEQKWFRGIHPDGSSYISWTMQMFKALGWGDWCLTPESTAALISHLNDREFIGRYGMHSLAKHDPFYDRNDVDNGGPGACISFAPAVVDRLCRCGRGDLAGDIFKRLYWLADAMPYWGDSQYAAMMEYRRDTPLQGDIQGAALAQSIIFGFFGISAETSGSIKISPVLPCGCSSMTLKNLRLCGKELEINVTAGGIAVTCSGTTFTGEYGSTLFI